MNKLVYIISLVILAIFSNYLSYFLNNINYKRKFKVLIKVISKFNIYTKIQATLQELKNITNMKNRLLSAINILFLSILFFFVSFILFFNKFKLILSSCFLAIICFFIPQIILDVIVKISKDKLREEIKIYIVNLQSFSKNTNNIVLAINNTKSSKRLNSYLEEFKTLVNNGYSVIYAFNELEKKINIKEINILFYLLKECYISGGNLNNLLVKFNDYYKEIENIRNKQNEKMLSMFSLLLFVFCINVLLVFGFCMSNVEYKKILIETFIGKLLFDINSFIYLYIFLYIRKVIKKE